MKSAAEIIHAISFANSASLSKIAELLYEQ